MTDFEKPDSTQEAEKAAQISSGFDSNASLARAGAPPVRSYSPSRVRGQILLGVAVIALLLVALIWWLSLKPKTQQLVLGSPSSQNATSVPPVAGPTIELPPPQQNVEPVVTQPEGSTPLGSSPQPETPPAGPSGNLPLLIPVAGVRPEQLRDTFQDSRSEGRSHDAIDIPAPQGTPVLAAADGSITKLFQSALGGTTIYQLGTDKRSVYYYAHLDRYADGLSEGHFARRGEVIGYVGDTGNAGAGNYHLHFSILIVADPKRYWEGTNINPYPLLRGTH